MPSKTDIPHALEPIQIHPGDKPPNEPKTHLKHFQKPTQHIRGILNGVGVSLDLSKSQGKLPLGVQFPTQPPADENIPEDEPGTVLLGEGISDWMMVGEGHVLAAKMSETEVLEPQNLAEAKSQPDWPLWEKAIQEELSVLKAAATWELVDIPEGANIVGLKWVFHAKKNAASIVICYKAQLVAQGFLQVPGINYFDMFVPVA